MFFKGKLTLIASRLRSAKIMLYMLAVILALGLSPVANSKPTKAIHQPPKFNVSSYILIDYDSGHIIAEHNIDKEFPPASLTKIMTAYVAAYELTHGGIDLSDRVLVSEKAWRTEGSKMFIEVGKKISVEDLLKGIIIQSGNDASIAIAEFIAGDEENFANIMNLHANRLGMVNTNFVNSSGLNDPGHYISARDLAILTETLIRDFPDIYAWHSILDFTFNGIKQQNRNQLLWQDPTVDGVKTGHTEDAGYCLVASAKKNDMRLISVVMGSKSAKGRFNASRALINYGFRFYETHKLYKKNQAVGKIKVWKGADEYIELGPDQDIYITVPRSEFNNLSTDIRANAKVIAPVEIGERLAILEIGLADEKILSVPLFSLQAIQQGNFMHRVKDQVKLLLDLK